MAACSAGGGRSPCGGGAVSGTGTPTFGAGGSLSGSGRRREAGGLQSAEEPKLPAATSVEAGGPGGELEKKRVGEGEFSTCSATRSSKKGLLCRELRKGLVGDKQPGWPAPAAGGR